VLKKKEKSTPRSAVNVPEGKRLSFSRERDPKKKARVMEEKGRKEVELSKREKKRFPWVKSRLSEPRKGTFRGTVFRHRRDVNHPRKEKEGRKTGKKTGKSTLIGRTGLRGRPLFTKQKKNPAGSGGKVSDSRGIENKRSVLHGEGRIRLAPLYYGSDGPAPGYLH